MTPERRAWSVELRLPVLFATLAGTAVPVALRPLQHVDLGLMGHDPADMLLNIAGFVPAGFVLAPLGVLRAVTVAAVLSLIAECCQLIALYRWPALADVMMNGVGAAVGAALAMRWPLSSRLVATPWRGIVAVVILVLIVCGAWGLKLRSNLIAGRPAATRGSGGLEAHWTFEGLGSQRVPDASGREIEGTIHGHATAAKSPRGGALIFEGEENYASFGQPPSLRLTGSLTLSAWINAASFPRDDAAIVSAHDGLGFQLDTTLDSGPRTVGFKLGGACGPIMARYGATALVTGKWYFVAGVYDADRRTMDVYVDGKLDNGLLLGPVAGSQQPSTVDVLVGRRNAAGYGFHGSIGDVRIYSRPLSGAEIVADMETPRVSSAAPGALAAQPSPAAAVAECPQIPDRDDARFPGLAALAGILAAIAMAGLVRPSRRWPCAAAGLAAGLILLPVTPSPAVGCLLAGLALLGGACVAFELRDVTG